MADISDVSAALVTTIAGIVYPNGTSQPSITGAPVLVPAHRLFRRDWMTRKRPLVSTGSRPLPVGRAARPVVALASS